MVPCALRILIRSFLASFIPQTLIGHLRCAMGSAVQKGHGGESDELREQKENLTRC